MHMRENNNPTPGLISLRLDCSLNPIARLDFLNLNLKLLPTALF